MSYGKMPPQAYTKETLQEAFEWWSEQSDEFRSQVQDKDDLVGYYLRSKDGAGAKANVKREGFTKAAKETFSSELKGLAKNLENFDEYSGANAKPAGGSGREHRPVFEPVQQMQFPDLSKTLVPASDDRTPSSALQTTKSNKGTSAQTSFFKLDANSKATVLRAKEALNLSTEDEALRALIALGKSKIKSIF